MSDSEMVRRSIQAAIAALESQGVPYMVVGSFSSNQWGVSRATRDLDLVLLSDEPIGILREAVKPVFRLDEQLSFETRTGKTKFLFQSSVTPFEIEVFIFSDDPFDQSRFARRVKRDSDGLSVWMQTPEDVIVQKLRWGRPKDIADVVDVMTVRAPSLDWPYIERWCRTHGTLEKLGQTKAEAGVTG